jgi:hypothetical protein
VGTGANTKVRKPALYPKCLPWFRPWIRKRGKNSSAPGCCTYSAKSHQKHHEDFKDKMSELFASQAKQVAAETGNVFVLDDFSKHVAQLRSLRALKRKRIESNRVYMANPGARQCAAAAQQGANAVKMKLEDALGKCWKGIASRAVYLDTCSGSSDYIQQLMVPLLARASHKYRLAFTILGRTSQRYDPEHPSCLISRLSSLDAFLVKRGFRKIGKSDQDAVFPYTGGSRVITIFYRRD